MVEQMENNNLVRTMVWERKIMCGIQLNKVPLVNHQCDIGIMAVANWTQGDRPSICTTLGGLESLSLSTNNM